MAANWHLPLLLIAHPAGKMKLVAKGGFQRRVAVDLAGDVADHPPQADAQELHLAPVPPELLGVRVALRFDQRGTAYI